MKKSTIVISNSVRESRIAQGFTQIEFAKLVGCSIEALTYIEDQRLMPSPKTVKNLCRVLKSSQQELFEIHEHSLVNEFDSNSTQKKQKIQIKSTSTVEQSKDPQDIRQMRIEKGLTQSQLAKALGITQGILSLMERKKINLREDKKLEIMNYLVNFE